MAQCLGGTVVQCLEGEVTMEEAMRLNKDTQRLSARGGRDTKIEKKSF